MIFGKNSWPALFLVVTAVALFSSCDRAGDALSKMAEADSLLEEGYFLKAAQAADQAVKLDSTDQLVYRRGMIFIEAGVILKEKTGYEEDGMQYLRRGIRDLEMTETVYEKNGHVYFYRAVAKSHTYDKVGACSDIYQAEAFGKRVPKKVWLHAECEEVERLAAESEMNQGSGPGMDYQDRPEPND